MHVEAFRIPLHLGKDDFFAGMRKGDEVDLVFSSSVPPRSDLIPLAVAAVSGEEPVLERSSCIGRPVFPAVLLQPRPLSAGGE